ncbi:glutamate-1-semialdehyde 2,1-aminomutase [bacterium]|nr:glutamate-1-semialdehyde 2,1-aminomutase [bacterium]
MKFNKSKEMKQRSHKLIPGGAHTYAKGDDQYPEQAPAFIFRGKGSHVWDVDGNEFIEYGMGLRAVTLGHAYPSVVEAATRELQNGSNFTRPSPLELECAEQFLSLIENAEMVKFSKNGSDATSAAVRVSRAHTGRQMVAICAEHPFFSIDDWFIGTTEMNSGIPEAIRKLTVKFHYNDIDSLIELFYKYENQIACVILEPATWMEPENGFLENVQTVCRKNNAVLIFDEMITGFRWDNGGAQKVYGIVPDLSTFGKGIANGFSLSALAGRKELMDLGGILHERERVFLLSTTHGAETHSLAAAIETMNVYKNQNVIETLYRQGLRLMVRINRSISDLHLNEYFQIAGRPCNLIFITRDQSKNPSQSFRTLFLQEMIQRGIIAPSFVVSFSHTDEDIDRTIDAASESLRIYQKALEDGIEKYLNGRAVKPVNRRYN